VHTAILYGTTDEFKHTTDRHTNPVMVRVRESLPTIMRHALCPSKCDGTKQIQITVRSVECFVAYLDAFQADIPFEPPARGVSMKRRLNQCTALPFARCEPRLSILASSLWVASLLCRKFARYAKTRNRPAKLG